MWALKLLSFVILLVLQGSRGQNFYTAAVVEHAPAIEKTSTETITKNLNSFKAFTKQAKDKGADIIAFPEYGLTSYVFDVENYAIEISSRKRENEHQVLKEIRSLAKEQNIYLVINLLEKEESTNNKTLYFNTNIVLDKKGNIIGKYRKINLFGEHRLTPGKDLIDFTTDFGVHFGLFTCFDLLFFNPSKTVLKKNVTDVIYPTAWLSHAPFLVSISAQHGYSVANGVNFLVAGYNYPRRTLGGSGIYLADGSVAEAYLDDSTQSKLIVQRVQKINQRQHRKSCTETEMTPIEKVNIHASTQNFITMRRFEYSAYKFKNIDLTKNHIVQEVCDEMFCCSFNISVAKAFPNDHFKLMAFDGMVHLLDTDEHIRSCALLACRTDEKETCGETIHPYTKFNSIDIRGNLPNEAETFYRPMTLAFNLVPIVESTYCINSLTEEGKLSVGLSLNKPREGILVFGILGRGSIK